MKKTDSKIREDRTPYPDSKQFSQDYAAFIKSALHEMDRNPEDVAAYMKLQIASDIYAAMETQGMDQSELARRLGKSRQYVSRVLNERTNFTLDSLARIACALNMRVAVRFFEHDEYLDIQPSDKPKKSLVDLDMHKDSKKSKSTPRTKGARKIGSGKG